MSDKENSVEQQAIHDINQLNLEADPVVEPKKGFMKTLLGSHKAAYNDGAGAQIIKIGLIGILAAGVGVVVFGPSSERDSALTVTSSGKTTKVATTKDKKNLTEEKEKTISIATFHNTCPIMPFCK